MKDERLVSKVSKVSREEERLTISSVVVLVGRSTKKEKQGQLERSKRTKEGKVEAHLKLISPSS